MKCLVTTLDGIVNDSSLPIFSALEFTAKTLKLQSVEPCPIYVNGTLRGEYSRIDILEDSAVGFSVRNRYAISEIITDEGVMLDVSDLTYMSELVSLNLTWSCLLVVGNWPSASNFPKLESISCGNDKTVVDFDEFGFLPKIKKILMPGGRGVRNGSIEQFVKNQRSIGNTNGNVEIFLDGITWQGKAVTLSSQSVIAWTATTISFNGTTITA